MEHVPFGQDAAGTSTAKSKGQALVVKTPGAIACMPGQRVFADRAHFAERPHENHAANVNPDTHRRNQTALHGRFGAARAVSAFLAGHCSSFR